LSAKHTKSTNGNQLATKNEQNEQNEQNEPKELYTCQNCNKLYKDRTGLWRHNQKCRLKEDFKTESGEEKKKDEITDKNLIMMLINENKELKALMLEQQNMMLKVIENGTHNNNTTNSHNTISNNKTFNLQFFLNETCKDAMNIMDFVESIKLQLTDLERVGELGYVEGISSIIVKNLKELDVTQRPVHCTDKKRETIYIKDEDKWEKDEEKNKIRKVIKKVVSKNQRLLSKFKDVHPDCIKASSKYSDQYNKIIVESMGGSGDNDIEKEDKIIRKITTATTIDKD